MQGEQTLTISTWLVSETACSSKYFGRVSAQADEGVDGGAVDAVIASRMIR